MGDDENTNKKRSTKRIPPIQIGNCNINIIEEKEQGQEVPTRTRSKWTWRWRRWDEIKVRGWDDDERGWKKKNI